MHGEQASRLKSVTTEFAEVKPGLLKSKVPKGVTVKFEFGDCLFPSPCYGVMLWGVYVECLQWKIVEEQPEEEFVANIHQVHKPPPSSHR